MKSEAVFVATTQIVAAQVRTQGMHVSPVLVSQAVDLAELIVAEIDRREDVANSKPPEVAPVAAASSAPAA